MRTRLHNIKQVVSLKGIMVALEEDGLYVRRGDQWHQMKFWEGSGNHIGWFTSLFAGDGKLLVSVVGNSIYELSYYDLKAFYETGTWKHGPYTTWEQIKTGISQAKEKDNE
jgi:hypothetical protein